MRKPKGIFCLERDWWNDLKRLSTVEPALRLLEKASGYRVPYIHRDVDTPESLEEYLGKWVQRKYSQYPILYLGFHGNEGCVHVGDGRKAGSRITLDWFEERLAGRCRGRVIFFASCETVGVNGNRLNRFLRNTDALAVCGYCTYVDWLEASAFELLVLGKMQDKAFTMSGANSIRKAITSDYGPFARRFEFKMVVKR